MIIFEGHDARRIGYALAHSISRNSRKTTRILAHSQGTRIALEAVYRAALESRANAARRQTALEEKEIIMVLAGIKVRRAYMARILKRVKRARPGWSVKILILQQRGDDIPFTYSWPEGLKGTEVPAGHIVEHKFTPGLPIGRSAHSEINYTGVDFGGETRDYERLFVIRDFMNRGALKRSKHS